MLFKKTKTKIKINYALRGLNKDDMIIQTTLHGDNILNYKLGSLTILSSEQKKNSNQLMTCAHWLGQGKLSTHASRNLAN